jgi:hypothetical protein
MINIPVLRWGQPYTSMDVDEVVHFADGQPIARVSRANGLEQVLSAPRVNVNAGGGVATGGNVTSAVAARVSGAISTSVGRGRPVRIWRMAS